jgi:phage gp29-like protein
MATPDLSELATIHSDPYIPQFQNLLQPSDPTLKGRGKGVELYDEIRRDPHAYAILQKRKLEVVSREWNVFEASEKRIDKKAAELVKAQLKGIDFDKLTRGLMGAVLKGYAVAEVMWANVDGVWTVKAVKVKKQRRFRFNVDGELRMLTRAQIIDGEAVPARKFIVHRHSIDDDDDDPYGIGIGSVLFWPAWFKRQALSHWLRGAEKHAFPTVMGTYPGDFDKERQDKLLDAFRKMANDTGIAVPEGVLLSLLESKGAAGGDIYEKINRYLDELMSEAVLGETLSTNSGERGARSLGEVHNEVRVAIAKADADLVCTTLRESIVTWIVELNFPGAAIPDVWRDFAEAEDLDARVTRDKAIFDMGYEPSDVQYFDDTYGGEWKKKATKPVDPSAPGQTPEVTAGLEFADNPNNPAAIGNTTVAQLAAQAQDLAQPAIDGMIEAIRTEFAEARDYDDLILRLARLSSEMGVDDLAGTLSQAMTLGRLEGHASVADGR